MPKWDFYGQKNIHNIYMNLFNYTKQLTEKIRFYDSIAQNPFLNMQNPFATPITVTIVWIEDDSCEK